MEAFPHSFIDKRSAGLTTWDCRFVHRSKHSWQQEWLFLHVTGRTSTSMLKKITIQQWTVVRQSKGICRLYDTYKRHKPHTAVGAARLCHRQSGRTACRPYIG